MERLEHLAGADDDWRRPPPTGAQRQVDVLVAVGFLLVTALGVELLRSIGALNESSGATSSMSR